MKKVLKTVLILCLAMTVLLAMTSCGTADNSSEPASAVTEFFGEIANWFNELGDAIMRFWQSLLDWFRQLFGIKPDCEHVYDNNCDAICNECGEERDAQAHQWRDATCTNPKTCKTCGTTEGEPLGHTPAEDDGDCTTPIKCVNCEQNAKAGATGHHDADHDYTCDNAGCQVTLGNPPKDESDGIDLPIDRN